MYEQIEQTFDEVAIPAIVKATEKLIGVYVYCADGKNKCYIDDDNNIYQANELIFTRQLMKKQTVSFAAIVSRYTKDNALFQVIDSDGDEFNLKMPESFMKKLKLEHPMFVTVTVEE